MLTEGQQRAFDQVQEMAAQRTRAFYSSLASRSPEALATLQRLDRLLATKASIEIAFHPDRTIPGGLTVAEGLLRDGVYRSQFETRISNGSRTAFSGGLRAELESKLFLDHYSKAEASERPKYGALNLLNHPEGSSPRFGSCYFVLDPSVSSRATFTLGDSVSAPTKIGTHLSMGSIWEGIVDEIDREGSTLGISAPTLSAFESRLNWMQDANLERRLLARPGRELDRYIEAQIHGEVQLGRDVRRLVADASFRGTEAATKLAEIADRYSIQLAFHAGFALQDSNLPDEFRGATVARLARHLSRNGRLTAVEIGAADRSLHQDPEPWSSWGSFDEVLQYIKQLWHAVVSFGRPYLQSDH